MKLLIVGGGGREHALAWKSARSERVEKVYIAPGNAGTALEQNIENIDIDAEDLDALLNFARTNQIDLTIVGPEAPLVAGIVDLFEENGLMIFGPSAGAAQLEGSKTFTKDFLERHQIPSAAYRSFTDLEAACAYRPRTAQLSAPSACATSAGLPAVLSASPAPALPDRVRLQGGR